MCRSIKFLQGVSVVYISKKFCFVLFQNSKANLYPVAKVAHHLNGISLAGRCWPDTDAGWVAL